PQQIEPKAATTSTSIATRQAQTDHKGLLLSMPVVTFYSTGGEPLAAGDQLKITANYDNPTGKRLRAGAMGIVVGYFVPANDAALAPLRHAAKSPTPHPHDMHDMKDMPNMSHDH